MAAFRIKKAYLQGLGSWLNDLSLSGAQSRARTRFVESLQQGLVTMDKDRVTILEKYADKDEKGEVKKETVDNSEQYVLSAENKISYAKEYADLLLEDYILDITDANRLQVEMVKDIVLTTDYKFGPRQDDDANVAQGRIVQMNDYNLWCEAFEAL